jgi:hypothetical protein
MNGQIYTVRVIAILILSQNQILMGSGVAWNVGAVIGHGEVEKIINFVFDAESRWRGKVITIQVTQSGVGYVKHG